MPFFSLILPVYNVKPYLQRCLQSIKTQSFSDYEILLVDDGSTDGSGELCDRIAEDDGKVRVIHKENEGLFSARNAGIKAATGEYLWFIDSDDWIEADALQILFQYAKNSPDILKFDYYRVQSDAVAVISNAKPGVYRDGDKEMLLSMAFFSAGSFVLSACTCIYKRAFLQQNSLCFVSERLVGSEDYLFNFQALLQAQCVQVIRQPLYNYFLRGGSLTQSYKPDLFCRFTELYASLQAYYEQAGALEQYAGAIASFFTWHLIHSGCIPHEYLYNVECSVPQRREKVRKILADPTTHRARCLCELSRFPLKKRIQILAMRPVFEPLFYWLYVVRKG